MLHSITETTIIGTIILDLKLSNNILTCLLKIQMIKSRKCLAYLVWPADWQGEVMIGLMWIEVWAHFIYINIHLKI